MIFIEVFAGTARLSKAVKEIGCQAMPVDKTADRSSQIHICIYDLADDSQCDDLLSFIEHNHENIVWIHCAPACGTASRARQKALPNLTAKGYHVAKPLRSEDFPHGVPGLSNTDKIRTETANLVYANTAKIIQLAFRFEIQCSLENPLNSLFWAVPEIQAVLAEIQGHDVIFDNCCHGGRPSTRILEATTGGWSACLSHSRRGCIPNLVVHTFGRYSQMSTGSQRACTTSIVAATKRSDLYAPLSARHASKGSQVQASGFTLLQICIICTPIGRRCHFNTTLSTQGLEFYISANSEKG